jgi:hypothetical protein
MSTVDTATAPSAEDLMESTAAPKVVGEEPEVLVMADTARMPLPEEIKETATEPVPFTNDVMDSTTEPSDTEEESEVAVSENGEAVAKASETSAASTSASKRLLLSCGETPSIRSILCSSPLPLEVNDDVDEAKKSFFGMFGEKKEEEDDATLDEFTEDSDISKPNRRIWVVTTAGLPWRTGTAVNPLLRALYLTRGRPKGYVTLVIPWLNDTSSRAMLYGENNSFPGGQQEQEEWIRTFCRERAQCEDEEKNLNILFYSAVYQKAFGSIFPSVDISSLIPDIFADVAILEEPEHLNWFRAPPDKKVMTERAKMESDDKAISDSSDHQHSDAEENIAETMKREKAELGWRKFRHVVGIIHTNYSAYMTQYAVGTSIIAAPALSMLSSIVVRAYCKRVIRLSAALPSLAPNKEVTCNVHGVRSEFLEPCKIGIQTTLDTDSVEDHHAAVYFIGKVIWAKGFDWLLQIQDYFRDATGDYFPIDVYGGGPDEKAITRAFFGRNALQEKKELPVIEPSLSEDDATAAAIFASEESLRDQVEHLKVEIGIPAIEVVPDESSPTGNSVQISQTSSSEGPLEEKEDNSTLTRSSDGALDQETGDSTENTSSEAPQEAKDDFSPLGIIGDLSSNTVSTGIATTQAVYSLTDNILKAGMKLTFSSKETASKFTFDPPKSTYELRRTPIPARFLGVKDHAFMRDIPAHKIFLNASVTEVLCTTTAEALAMGKFALIPKHRKYINLKNVHALTD